MSIEDQFDVAAQDRRADAARAVIEAAKLAGKLEALADEIETEALADEIETEALAEAEVPEVPGKVEQEPEIQVPRVMPTAARTQAELE